MDQIYIPPNTSLIRTVLNNKELFHTQDWYHNEDFAYRAVEGAYDLDDTVPAAVWAYLYVEYVRGGAEHALHTKYVWTSDVDDHGDLVYVGRAGHQKQRFQIHRHLTIRREQFLNSPPKTRKKGK